MKRIHVWLSCVLLALVSTASAKELGAPQSFPEDVLIKHNETGELYKAIMGRSEEKELAGITAHSAVEMKRGPQISILNFSIYFLKNKKTENVWAALLKKGATLDTMPDVEHYNTKLGDKGGDNGGQDPYTDPLFLAAVVGEPAILDAFSRRGRTFKWMAPAHFLYILDGADAIKDEQKKADFKHQLLLLTDKENAIEIILSLQEKMDNGQIEEMGGMSMWGHVIDFLHESVSKREVAAYVARGIKLKFQQTAKGAWDTFNALGKSVYKRIPFSS